MTQAQKKNQLSGTENFLPKVVKAAYHPTQWESFSWKKVFSDHPSQIINITPTIQLLSWNIMTRGRQGMGENFNNAYRHQESKNEYESRLDRIISSLVEETKANPFLAVMTLQEFPNDSDDKEYMVFQLKARLPNWEIDDLFYQQSMGNNFGLMTLYHKEKVIEKPNKVTIEGLEEQKGRILAIDYVFKGHHGEPQAVRVVNGHFRLFNITKTKKLTEEEGRKEIEKILRSTEKQVVIAGDFNQEVNKLKGDNVPYGYNNHVAISYSYNKTPDLQKNFVDGFFFKYKPETHQFIQTTEPVKFTKK